jgi:serine/threonine protein kinase
MIGKTLGHYTVSTLIGRGGMGEVYQAKDQKLGRDVAIKVLPEEFARDAYRIARFQREANLYAAPFDVNALKITGGQVPVVEGISNSSYFYSYAISYTGTMAYVPGDSTALNQRTFVWVDREGKEEPFTAPANSYYDHFKLSPDGTRVALSRGKYLRGER